MKPLDQYLFYGNWKLYASRGTLFDDTLPILGVAVFRTTLCARILLMLCRITSRGVSLAYVATLITLETFTTNSLITFSSITSKDQYVSCDFVRSKQFV